MAKNPENMLAQVRRQAIAGIVNQEGNVTVAELCGRFHVSPATIRNDLRDLEEAGVIERAHGGAIARNKAAYELNSRQKQVKYVEEKAGIAKAARSLIEPGDAIVLDTGTTTFQLAKLLGGIERLTVVTNDIEIATWLEYNTDVSIVLAGGSIRKNFHCTVGQTALDSISRLNVDKAFVAVNGLSLTSGLTTPNVEMAAMKAAFIASARQVVLLADSSKLNQSSFVSYAEVEQIDMLITDAAADKAFLSAVKQRGPRVVIAGEKRMARK